MSNANKTVVFINRTKFELPSPTTTGRALKELAGISLGDTLFRQRPREDEVVPNDSEVVLKDGDHLFSQPPANYGAGPDDGAGAKELFVFINKVKWPLSSPTQTGAGLKTLAGIPLGDTLFRARPKEDEVIPNDATVVLERADHLFSSPPADYGGPDPALADVERDGTARIVKQPDGWTFVIFDYPVPCGFRPERTQLLVKLPPLFPDAAPDMFWVKPALTTPGGGQPRNTCMEQVLGEMWQRFSWHLQPGAWKPGVSDLRDFMRCIRSRFERKD